MKEVHLSGNSLFGQIPQIWEKLSGVEKIEFFKMGLVGEIPPSMGVYLKNQSYLRLDNNNLEVLKQEEFSKGERRFLKLKKIGGDEGTILKYKVKAREKNHLTNEKPKLDIMSQCSILIL
ncbi:hypothetical protein RYX36_031603 [Vicia faba]